jgi:hypothetical protein
VDEIDHGHRTVAGVPVRIIESVWNGGVGSSFEVYRRDTGDCLTMDEAFDAMPDDDQIRELIEAPRDEYGGIDWSQYGKTD